MTHNRLFLLILIVCVSLLIAISGVCSRPLPSFVTHNNVLADCCFAAPRWWEETVAWVRSIGWDRGRLVQLWLFFMLLGLFVMLRIKPRG
jgi:hypothetical protein